MIEIFLVILYFVIGFIVSSFLFGVFELDIKKSAATINFEFILIMVVYPIVIAFLIIGILLELIIPLLEKTSAIFFVLGKKLKKIGMFSIWR